MKSAKTDKIIFIYLIILKLESELTRKKLLKMLCYILYGRLNNIWFIL